MLREYINWKDAFSKYGFRDGEECHKTETVARFLRAKGYHVTTEEWGPHNIIVWAISKDGKDFMPVENYNYEEDPSKQIGADVVALLEERFGKGEWYL